MRTPRSTGLLNDIESSPARSGGISYEVSSLAYFSELLDGLNELGQELEGEDDATTIHVHEMSVRSRIESRLTNMYIKRGQLEREEVIVGDEANNERQPLRSPRTRRIFSFPSRRARTFTPADTRSTSSRADSSRTGDTSRAARGA